MRVVTLIGLGALISALTLASLSEEGYDSLAEQVEEGLARVANLYEDL